MMYFQPCGRGIIYFYISPFALKSLAYPVIYVRKFFHVYNETYLAFMFLEPGIRLCENKLDLW